MNYEEKYNASLEVAQKWYNSTNSKALKSTLECIFPELVETENEKLLKKAIDYFKNKKSALDNFLNVLNEDQTPLELREERELCNEMISYLEAKKWTKEDEELFDEVMNSGRNHCYLNLEEIEWIKSLRERLI